MGILNATPDSFYAGSRKTNIGDLLRLAEQMLADGADILDIGGYSSRPGAEHISEEQEQNRVVEAIAEIHNAFPKAIISVDTFRASVANAAVSAGAAIVNDISGGSMDADLHAEVSKLGVPYVLMHMRGTPKNMGQLTDYEDVLIDLVKYFSHKIESLRSQGVSDIVVDPGFGFAKTPTQGFSLLHNLRKFQLLECPVLVGVSRKSMISKTLGITPEEALNGTTVLNTIALMNGANLLRVHDVKEAAQAIALCQLVG